jgi:hypothetical protein
MVTGVGVHGQSAFIAVRVITAHFPTGELAFNAYSGHA